MKTNPDHRPPAAAVRAARTPQEAPAAAKCTRVVILDDHESLRQMLAFVLKTMGGFEVVGEASGGVSGLRVCRDVRPDVVILDLALPELNGVHLIRFLRAEVWKARVLVYTGTMDESLMRAALAEQPEGFVRKEDTLPELRAALTTVAAGGTHFSPWTTRLRGDRAHSGIEKLTADEAATLQMISEGMQNKEIAEVLGTTPKQVDNLRQRVMAKLGLHDVASLTKFAVINQFGSK